MLTYGDSSTSSDSFDEDLLDEIFVSSMFPDYKVDYPRTNIDDLNDSVLQCLGIKQCSHQNSLFRCVANGYPCA